MVEVARLLRRYKPNILHTHLSKAGLVGRTVAQSMKIHPLVHTYHGVTFQGHFSRFTSTAIVTTERTLGRFTDAVVAVSDQTRETLLSARVADPSRIRVIAPGIALPKGKDRELPDRKVIVWVGRAAQVKQLSVFIEAALLLANRRNDVTFTIVGDGPDLPGAVARVATTRHGDLFSFTGWMQDPIPVLQAATVLVLTSKMEGMPVSIIEAQAVGLPVLAPAVGGVPSLIEHDRTGILCAGGSSSRCRVFRSPCRAGAP